MALFCCLCLQLVQWSRGRQLKLVRTLEGLPVGAHAGWLDCSFESFLSAAQRRQAKCVPMFSADYGNAP